MPRGARTAAVTIVARLLDGDSRAAPAWLLWSGALAPSQNASRTKPLPVLPAVGHGPAPTHIGQTLWEKLRYWRLSAGNGHIPTIGSRLR